ncbi:MAG: hypothetical protein FD180_603 [Planctomycetota bacterium]|nr:MAG: hypothetical protein FD180_603 [Planctomycetota bacterium]
MDCKGSKSCMNPFAPFLLAIILCSCAAQESHDALDSKTSETRRRIDARIARAESAIAKSVAESNASPSVVSPEKTRASLVEYDALSEVDLVEPAEDATVSGWIIRLGDATGSGSRKAWQKLLEQGLRVAGRLQEASREDSLSGIQASSLLDVMDPEITEGWCRDGLAGWGLIENGSGFLAWTGDPPRTLVRIATSSGETVWSVTEQALTDIVGGNGEIWWNPRQCPELDSLTHRYILVDRGALRIEVDGITGKLEATRGFRRDFEVPLPPEVSSDRASLTRRFSDGVVVMCRKDGAWIRSAGRSSWNDLTVGSYRKHALDVGVTPFRILVLYQDRLLLYDRANFKLLEETIPIRDARWMSVQVQEGLVFLGAPGWTSFGVLGGSLPRPLGRSRAYTGRMVAMTGDPDGRWVAAADREGLIRVFLGATLERIATLESGMRIQRLEFVADPPTLVAISATSDWPEKVRIRTWNFDASTTAKK